MRARTTCASLLSSLLLLTSCADDSPQSSSSPSEVETAINPASPVEELPSPEDEGATEPNPDLPPAPLAIDALPAMDAPRDATCPYIDGVFMEQTTGQRWTGTSVDESFVPPACTFWSFEPYPQAIIMVRHMNTPQEAVAVVDWAAPIDSTEKTEDPSGWSGGRRGGSDLSHGGEIHRDGAVYSVFKDRTAVTVFTAQQQSAKAKAIAIQVIDNLHL